MKVFIVGAGVIGTVYGAHLAVAGSTVDVLSHGPRTDEVAAAGLCARDVTGGGFADAEAAVVPDASGTYDIVLIAVRRDQLASACAGLTAPGRQSSRAVPRQQPGRPGWASLAACPVTSTSGSPGSAAS